MPASKAFRVPVAAALGLILLGAACASCNNKSSGTAVVSATGGGAGSAVAGAGGMNATGGAGNDTGRSGGTGGGSNGAGGGSNGTGGGSNGSTAGSTGVAGGGVGGAIGGTAGVNGATGGINGSGSVLAAGVRWFGRVDTTDPSRPRFGWSGTGFIARIAGTSLAVQLDNAGAFVFKAVVDGVAKPAFATTTGQGTYSLATGLASGTHTVAVYRQTEGVYGDSQFLGLTVGAGTLVAPPAASGRLIEVVGASVSCGYGDLGTSPCAFSFATESHFDAYESVAARAVNADLSVVAISGRGMYRNADGTTDGTMPKLYSQILAGAATPVWTFPTTPQVVVINLGKNDFAVGDPGVAFREAYLAFMRTLRTRYPNAFIVCTTGPNLGDAAHAGQLGYVNQVFPSVIPKRGP